jgi:hypothetical protein
MPAPQNKPKRAQQRAVFDRGDLMERDSQYPPKRTRRKFYPYEDEAELFDSDLYDAGWN